MNLRAVIAALCLCSGTATAQYVVPATTGPGGVFTFGNVTATGQVGSTISFMSMPAAPSMHTVSILVSGTAPTACTLDLQGSLDGVNWQSLSGTQSCTASTMFHVVQKAVPLVRVLIDSYTASTGTVSVSYARGPQ